MARPIPLPPALQSAREPRQKREHVWDLVRRDADAAVGDSQPCERAVARAGALLAVLLALAGVSVRFGGYPMFDQ